MEILFLLLLALLPVVIMLLVGFFIFCILRVILSPKRRLWLGILGGVFILPPVSLYVASYVGWTVVAGMLALVLAMSGFFRWFAELVKRTPKKILIVYITIGLVIAAWAIGHYVYINSADFKRERVNGDLAAFHFPVIPDSARFLEIKIEDEANFLLFGGSRKVTFKAALGPDDLIPWKKLEGLEEYTVPPVESYMTPAKPKPKTNVIHKENVGYVCHFAVDEQAGTVQGSISTHPVFGL